MVSGLVCHYPSQILVRGLGVSICAPIPSAELPPRNAFSARLTIRDANLTLLLPYHVLSPHRRTRPFISSSGHSRLSLSSHLSLGGRSCTIYFYLAAGATD